MKIKFLVSKKLHDPRKDCLKELIVHIPFGNVTIIRRLRSVGGPFHSKNTGRSPYSDG